MKRNILKFTFFIIYTILIIFVISPYLMSSWSSNKQENTLEAMNMVALICPYNTTEITFPWELDGYVRYCAQGLNGPWEIWENKSQKIKGKYKNGEKIGIWRKYNQQGIVISTKKYKIKNNLLENDYVEPNILKSVYGNKIDLSDGITFMLGPWYAPKSEYGFHIINKKIFIAHKPSNGHENHIIKISDCPKIEEQLIKLRKATLDTAKMVAKVKSPKHTNIISMDGYSYELSFYDNHQIGQLILKGGTGTELTTPWIDSALVITEIAELCEKP